MVGRVPKRSIGHLKVGQQLWKACRPTRHHFDALKVLLRPSG
jgi:hypothetical protein